MQAALVRLFSALACALLLGNAQAFEPPSFAKPKTLQATGTVQLAFTPEDDATGMIVKAVEEARKQVLAQAFSFTSREIAAVLVAAKERGVDVQLIADEEQLRKIEKNRIGDIAAGGVPVFIDSRHVAAHNKVMVIDAGTANGAVVTGSFNFTYGAQHNNAENVLILRGNPALTDAYLANWKRHKGHSRPYRR
jgi:phosphatidylserine/phosphatidylglycerophosphate/cardiolipin synthase-like enzyme